MAMNLASKFSSKLDQAFKLSSYTDPYVNQDYDFDGVNSIKVYTLDTVDLSNYDIASTTDRYGGFSEISDTVATYTLTNDKAFKKALDKLNENDSQTAKKAGQWLALEMNEIFVPLIDKNRLAVATAAASDPGGGGDTTYVKANVLKQLRAINAAWDEMSVPMNGRVFFITPTVLNDLKEVTDTNLSYTSNDAIKKRQEPVGTIDGVPIVVVPSNLMPNTGTNAEPYVVAWHKSALLSARKLTETRIITDSEHVSGWLMMGRFRYDSFALKGDGKKLATFMTLVRLQA